MPFLRPLSAKGQGTGCPGLRGVETAVLLVRSLPCSAFGMEGQFLHTPVQDFAHIKRVFRRTGDLVNPAKLSHRAAAAAEHAEDFAIERQLIDSPRECVRAVEHLVGTFGYAD